jgi:hypothetical protein
MCDRMKRRVNLVVNSMHILLNWREVCKRLFSVNG